MGVLQLLEPFTLLAEVPQRVLSPFRFQEQLVHSFHRDLLSGKHSLVHNPIPASVQFTADLQFRGLGRQRQSLQQLPYLCHETSQDVAFASINRERSRHSYTQTRTSNARMKSRAACDPKYASYAVVIMRRVYCVYAGTDTDLHSYNHNWLTVNCFREEIELVHMFSLLHSAIMCLWGAHVLLSLSNSNTSMYCLVLVCGLPMQMYINHVAFFCNSQEFTRMVYISI